MKMKLAHYWNRNNKAGKEVEVNAIKYDESFSGCYAVRARLGRWIWVAIEWFMKVDEEPVEFVKLP
jgi:hypothetical protein